MSEIERELESFEARLDGIERQYIDSLDKVDLVAIRSRIRVHLLGREKPDYSELVLDLWEEYPDLGVLVLPLIVHEVLASVYEECTDFAPILAERSLTAREKEVGILLRKRMEGLPELISLVGCKGKKS